MSARPTRVPQSKFPPRLNTIFFSSHPSLASKRKVQLIHKEPNVFLIDDFLSSSELQHIDHLITANESAFSKSYTESGSSRKVHSDERTSNFLHLTKSQDRVVRNIEQRAADLVGMSVQHVEPLQVVRYTKDQKFGLHHDSGTLLNDSDVEPVQPVRFVTFFVYLNTLPSGLGSTEFPRLGLQVNPRKGSAVLFCNVLPDYRPDPRLIHQALPVQYPELWKYGMNIWISSANQQIFAHQPSGVRLRPRLLREDDRRGGEEGKVHPGGGATRPKTALTLAEEMAMQFSVKGEGDAEEIFKLVGDARVDPTFTGNPPIPGPLKVASAVRQKHSSRKRKAADMERVS